MPDAAAADTLQDTAAAALAAETGADKPSETGAAPAGTTPDAPATPPAKADGPPEDIEELKRGWMRQEDYTRKTMALADMRRGIEEQRAALEARLAAGGSPLPPAVAEPAELTADGLTKLNAQEFAAWLLAERKRTAEDLRTLKGFAESLRPVAQRERVAGVFHSMIPRDPEIASEGIRVEVARLLDGNSQLQKLAESDPETALGIAIDMARANKAKADAEAALAAAKKTHAARVAAAPPPTTSGPTTMAQFLSPLQAAERAFQEEGLLTH